ncbi:cytochrome P450 [Nemania sp. FL0916]|nr:cytochrome P450 [Nemania sp. FL0916]
MLVLTLLRAAAAYTSYLLVFYVRNSARSPVLNHRLLLHPLRKYPGPLLAKLTQAYAGFYAARKRLHIEVYQYHKRYGPVVRVGPNRLSFNTATALRDIYQNERITKATTYLVTTRNNVVNVFTALDNNLHRQKRQIVGQAVSDRSLRAFEPVLLEKLDITLKQILHSSRTSAPIDMTEKSRQFALDVIGQLAFGYDLHVQTREDNRFMLKGMTFGNFRGNVYQHFPFLSKFYIDTIGDKVFYEARERYFRLLEKMISTRVAQDKNAKNDFYSIVADSFQDGSRGGDLWLEAIFFLVAGGDTTATAICGTFFYLSRYPECYRKLAQEVRSTFTHGREIKTGPQLASCNYLRACIDESMRMSPPVSTTLWREQVSGGDTTEPLVVDGQVIPRGTIVGVNIYALHHNEEYFPDSFTYNPERWMGDGGASKKINSAAFAPFSTGARSCAGKSMAYLETSLIVAKTLWYFDFEPAPGKLGEVGGGVVGANNGRERLNEFQLEDIFTSRFEGPHLVFKPREATCKDLE